MYMYMCINQTYICIYIMYTDTLYDCKYHEYWVLRLKALLPHV